MLLFRSTANVWKGAAESSPPEAKGEASQKAKRAAVRAAESASSSADAREDARVDAAAGEPDGTGAHGTEAADAVRAEERKRELVEKVETFNAWLGAWRQSDEMQREQLQEVGPAMARVRREALKELIALDPREALAMAVPRTLRGELPAGVVAELETPVDAYAHYDVAAYCFGEYDRVERTAVIEGVRRQVFTYGARLGAMTKERMPLHGVAIDERMAVAEVPFRALDAEEKLARGLAPQALAVAVGNEVRTFASTDALQAWSARVTTAESVPGPTLHALAQAQSDQDVKSAKSTWATGDKKVLVIRVDFSDRKGTPKVRSDDKPITTATTAVLEKLFKEQIEPFYAKSSYGRTRLITTVAKKVYRLPRTAAHYATNGMSFELLDDATRLAEVDHRVSSFDRVVVLFANLSGLPGSQFNFGGLGAVGGTQSWLNGSITFRTVTHELGHNCGLEHAGLWQVTDGNPISAKGKLVEYGDLFDIMGGGSDSRADFTPQSKQFIGWIDAARVKTVSKSGVYRIGRFDHKSASRKVLALKIPGDEKKDYWIGYRRAITDNPHLGHGAYVTWGYRASQSAPGMPGYPGSVRSMLLDLTTPGKTAPGRISDAMDAALTLGDAFTDPELGVRILPVARGGSSPNQYLDVRIDLGATGKNRNPSFTFTPPSGTVSARKSVKLKVKGSDKDGDTIYYKWDLGDGAIYPTTSSLSHRWVKGGSRKIKITAHDGRGGIAKKTVTVKVKDPLLSWTRRGSGVVGSELTDITYGSGRFTAVGRYGDIVVSADGVSWMHMAQNWNHRLLGVASGGGRTVAVGSNDGKTALALYSVTPDRWEEAALPSGIKSLEKVAYGNGRFVAVGSGGVVITSTDGRNWTKRKSGVKERLVDIHYANKSFVAVGEKGRIMVSTTGSTWTNRTPALESDTFTAVSWHEGAWYACSNLRTWTSKDAKTWSASVELQYRGNVQNLSSFDGALMGAAGITGHVRFAIDGNKWDEVEAGASPLTATAVGNGTVVAVGHGGIIIQSGTPKRLAAGVKGLADGAVLTAGKKYSWAVVRGSGYAKYELLVDGKVVAKTTSSKGSLTWTPPRFGTFRVEVRATTSGGTVVVSNPVTVGATLTWTSRAIAGVNTSFADVTHGGAGFVAVGPGGGVQSPDGVVWTSWSDGMTGTEWRGVAFGAGRYVAVGSLMETDTPVGITLSSSDGQTWTKRTLPKGTRVLQGVAFGKGRFVAVGDAGQIRTSTDGQKWTTVSSGVTANLFAVRWGGSQFVAVGDKGYILTSADGLKWTRRKVSGLAQPLSSVAYLNKSWFVTTSQQVWRSTDGKIWQRISSITAWNGKLASALGTLFVLSGWTTLELSDDGWSWATVTLSSGNWGSLNAVAEGNGVVVGAGGNGCILQAGTPTAIAPSLKGVTSGALLTAGKKATLEVVAKSYKKLELLVDGVVVASTSGTTKLSWTPGFGVWQVRVRGTTSAGAVLVSPAVQVSAAPSWVQRESESGWGFFTAVTYGDGQFVATTQNGRILVSPDGATWTDSRRGGEFVRFSGVAEAGGYYVAVGGRYRGDLGRDVGIVFASGNGMDWHAGVVPQAAGNLTAVASGAGRFVAVGDNGTICVAEDGITWTKVSSGLTAALRTVRFADGLFVAAGEGGAIVTSKDGLAWTKRSAGGLTDTVVAVVRRSGVWYALTPRQTWRSSTGSTWTLVAYQNVGYLSGATLCGGLLVGFSGKEILFSPNGLKWGLATVGGAGGASISAIAEGNGTSVAVGGGGKIYQAGTPRLLAPKLTGLAEGDAVNLSQPASCTVSGSQFAKLELLVDGKAVASRQGAGALAWTPVRMGQHDVCVRGTTVSGETMISTAVRVSAVPTWTRRAQGLTSNDLDRVIHGGGRFVAIGSAGAMVASSDGVNWNAVPLGLGSLSLYAVAESEGRFVVTGSRYDWAEARSVSVMAYSADGVTWQLGSGPSDTRMLRSVAGHGQTFVAVGDAGRISLSTDRGETWSNVASGVSIGLATVQYANGRFVVGGEAGVVLSSPDGQTWTKRNLSDTMHSVAGLTYLQGAWFAVLGSEIWSSADAENWTSLGHAPSTSYAAASGAGLLLLPQDRSIMFSSDGVSWGVAKVEGDSGPWVTSIAEHAGTLVVVGSNGAVWQATLPEED